MFAAGLVFVAIPKPQKKAIAARAVADRPAALVASGKLASSAVPPATAGFELMLALDQLGAAGAFIIGILVPFFAPPARAIPSHATAPAIHFVAGMAASPLAEIGWKEPTEYAPAVVTALGMPLPYSIATGIGPGFATYIAVKALSGRVGQLSPAVLLIGAVFVLRFAPG